MNVPKVSIIIPIYNVEKYVEQCIKSVVEQTLGDIEIICIDDCSTDNSISIVESYANHDSRIKIIRHEVNKGLGIARNTGINSSSGDYIFFLDSDDYILPDTLEKLYTKIRTVHSDIVTIRAKAFPDEDLEEIKNRAEISNQWLDKFVADKYYVTLDNYIETTEKLNCTVWGKLYSKDFIQNNHLRFIEKKIMHEDNGFWLKVCSCFPVITYMEDLGLMYRIRRGAITDIINQRKLHNKKKKHLKLNMYDTFAYFDNYRKSYADDLKNLVLQSSLFNPFSEKRLSFLFRLRWTKDDKMLSFFGLPVYREKVKNGDLKVGRLFGIRVCKQEVIKNVTTMPVELVIPQSQEHVYEPKKIIPDMKKELESLDSFKYLPNKGNWGDVLISSSAYQLLGRYKYDIYDFAQAAIFDKKKFNFVYGGGGLWTGHFQKDYQEILNIFKSPLMQKCIILPSSFRDCPDVMETLDERFTVFCRENESYNYCLANNNKAKFLLADDLVVNANFDAYKQNVYNTNNLQKFMNNKTYVSKVVNDFYYKYVQTRYAVTKELSKYDNFDIGYMFRTDSEKLVDIPVTKSIDLSSHICSYCCDEGLCYCLSKLFLYVINQFDMIVTDRLHIGVSAAKLGKQVIFLDNSYGKISSIFKYSLSDWDNVHLTTKENLENDIAIYRQNITKTDKNSIKPITSVEEFLLEYGSFLNKFGAEKTFR